MEFVEQEDVKFIRLAFCNVYGKQHNVAIMPGELPRAFAYGIAIDASAIEGFGGEVRSDLLLRPDPSTLIQLPWTNTASPPPFPTIRPAIWTSPPTTRGSISGGRSA